MFRTTHCLCQPAIYRRYSRYGILHNANLLFCASFRQADDFHGAAQTVFHIFFRPKLCHDDFHSVCSLWNPAFWLLVRQAIPWKPAYPGGKLLQALVLGIICLVPGLQLLSSVLTNFFAYLFPQWMDFYVELMDSAGFTGQPSLLLILYAVILGPIEEELTFRGVILSSAKKALPFWAANFFQALLFGVFHMNFIQGIYAFFIGLFLGYICKRGASIWLSIFLHILFNLWGTFASSVTALLNNPLYSILFLLFSVLLGILGMVLFYKNTSPADVKHFPENSDM